MQHLTRAIEENCGREGVRKDVEVGGRRLQHRPATLHGAFPQKPSRSIQSILVFYFLQT